MTESLLLFILAAISVVIGVFIGIYIQGLKSKTRISTWTERENQLQSVINGLRADMEKLQGEKADVQRDKEATGLQLARKEAELENLRQKNEEQKEEVERLQEKFTREFENLANKILDEKSNKFTQQNKENIKNILSPLQEKILLFEKKVEESQKESISIHSALREQLLNLQSQNLKITQEAENLTRALKGDSKMQGNWGELVLERVLEKSGLEKGREYEIQQSFTTEDGSRVLPDVIIHLPDGKKMVIDSKVSLTAYERFVNAEEEQKDLFMKEHVNSIKRHIEQLSGKKYEDLYEMESPDFVLMFIPIEPAFAIAINQDNSLYNKAFDKNIVIVTPSTLLATLRTIDTMWNNEKQQRNAIDIARQAGALYDKFEGFITDLTKVGKKMDEAKTEYKGAMNKLFEGRGNIITSIEKLKKMGAKAKKSLPEAIVRRAGENEEDE
ncbi:DNA recombination protein RmuC [Sinomicrobium pectinilyticum]|uniref:DNA recombination protein RmuC n=1 Tax=Sinomicrobium pectinilyticum TaxID=1084421 RepID=A0A3N0E5K9_SINP1|nr:DNA recombination protein RmuC [Sinomicrobium pectinilyticum]RNL83126.1 DNA recombination protein RmuC [Sinomicrobium pectinilyticum]